MPFALDFLFVKIRVDQVKKRITRLLIFIAVILVLPEQAALADATSGAALSQSQMQIVAKVLSFLSTRPQGTATVLVLTGAASASDARDVFKTFTITEGSPADAVGAFAAIVRDSRDAQSVSKINPKILIITANADCVDQGACTIAVQLVPRIQILFSQAAAARSGVSFQPSFKLLVHER